MLRLDAYAEVTVPAVPGSAGMRPAGVDHKQAIFRYYQGRLTIVEGSSASLHQADAKAAVYVTGELIRHVHAVNGLHMR